MRGEYFSGSASFLKIYGSSPRAWGIRHKLQLPLLHPRFIPTCVGNTFPTGWKDYEVSVHPHVRGEYSNTGSTARPTGGSSPRAWGIRIYAILRTLWRRFIPTCVGNTLSLKISTINALNTTLKSTEAFLANPAGSEQEKTRPSPLVPCNSFRSSQRKIPIHYGNSRP